MPDIHTAVGRYGIDCDNGEDNLTDAEWDIVLAETTKNIKAEQDMKEAALSLHIAVFSTAKRKTMTKRLLIIPPLLKWTTARQAYLLRKTEVLNQMQPINSNFVNPHQNRGLVYWRTNSMTRLWMTSMRRYALFQSLILLQKRCSGLRTV
jgi:hypothetical protein